MKITFRQLLLTGLPIFLAILFAVLYFTKPYTKVEYVEKEVEVNTCDSYHYSDSTLHCSAAEACKKAGGKLKSYRDEFASSPEFECQYGENQNGEERVEKQTLAE